MGGGHRPEHGVATAFRNLSIRPSTPSLPCRAVSLDSVPQVRTPTMQSAVASPQSASSPTASSHGSTSDSEHTRFFQDSTRGSRAVAAHVFLSKEGTHGWARLSPSGRLSLQVEDEPGFAPNMRSVHPMLATRYKWRTACANARQMDTPGVEPFLSAMHRESQAHRRTAKVKYDCVRSASSAPLSRPSPLSMSSPKLVHWPSSTASISRVTGLCTAGRTERNTLMRLSPPRLLDASLPLPAGSAPVQHPLPGPLRCALAHAPCARVRMTRGLQGLQPPSLLRAPQPREGGVRVAGFPEFWEAIDRTVF